MEDILQVEIQPYSPPQCSLSVFQSLLFLPQLYIRSPAASKGQSVSKTAVTSPTTPQPVVPQQMYTPVLKKFSGESGWPQQAVILPGNEVMFSLETASDYVKDEKV